MNKSSGKSLVPIIVAINISFILGMITHKVFFTESLKTDPIKPPAKSVTVNIDQLKDNTTTVHHVSPAPTKVKVKRTTVKTKSNTNFGKPLDYRKAINGTIRELPASKLPTAGILVDMNTRKVLWCKNPRKAVPIASMTKMMTILLAIEDISNPRNNIDTETVIKVTREASAIGGSQIFLDPRESLKLGNLLKAIAIKSANDAAYLVGQYLGHGDINIFVKRMNARAKQLGMKNTHFNNPNGLPEKTSSRDNKSTPEDLVILAERLLQYPDVTKLTSTYLTYLTGRYNYKTKKYDGKTQLVNTNRLVQSNSKNGGVSGVDGMKTGFINRAGFCSTVTCKRGGRRLISVVMGFKSSKTARDPFVRSLLNWGYSR